MNHLFLGFNGEIGKSIFNEIYNKKDKFILTYNTKKPAINKKNIFLFKIDFNKNSDVKIKISKIMKKFEKIDILINNIGNGNPFKSSLELKLGEIEQSMRINFYSPLFIIIQFLKKSLKEKKKLNIINISTNKIKFYEYNNNLHYFV